MTSRSIDILCSDFTPYGINKNFIDNEEEHSRFAQVGRARQVVSYEVPEFLKRMDSLGMQKVFVVAIKTWSVQQQALLEHSTNEEVITVIGQAPGRLYGLFGINVHQGIAGVAEMERMVKEHGFIGAHLHPHGFGKPPDHAHYFPYYAKCQELGIPLIVSTGHTLDLMPNSPGRPMHLDDIALYFKDLAIVCTHTGWPWVEEAIALAWKHPNVFLGTSAYAPKHWPPEIVHYLDTYGRSKVLFGTDWPVIDPERAVAEIAALDLRPESRRALMRENALRVFRLPESAAAG